jgi:hypothetical protein
VKFITCCNTSALPVTIVPTRVLAVRLRFRRVAVAIHVLELNSLTFRPGRHQNFLWFGWPSPSRSALLLCQVSFNLPALDLGFLLYFLGFVFSDPGLFLLAPCFHCHLVFKVCLLVCCLASYLLIDIFGPFYSFGMKCIVSE